jgi:hypothetical protein
MIVMCASLLFAGSIVVWALLLNYYGGDHCTHTNAFVSVTIVLSVIVTVVSVMKKVYVLINYFHSNQSAFPIQTINFLRFF